MKKIIIISTVAVFAAMVSVTLYFGLTTKSFEGSVSEVDNDQVLVDCPIVKLARNVDDIGYMCKVQTTASTMILNINGEKVSMADIERGNSVEVVLAKRSFLTENSSRDVRAEKITVLNE
ncbi:hypothetical protein F9U64_17945 [Gracilibacillus oryzae]|uniref:DUF3221 domain-containing protein n=1 Tax=Gracilibacillus oryzae TaxID=1672701 RepID=A0A7C8GRH1_9BACI|nr:hypothetical protein [Gracilibacillus oryzae]KAB8127393.1 hypothetical protein F9U64_17945 [Gracilibacillus oryzae]